jgi:2-keto-4-pentenoate hydratase
VTPATSPERPSDLDVQRVAMMLLTAHRERRLIEPISATEELTLDTAYRVQRIVTEARLARGEQIVGWKLGYTSQAMRLQMGVAQPNFGPLTDAMLLPNDGTVDPTLVQPRVEPEIGIMLARPLEGGATLDDVLGATAHAFACLEVVDSVYVDYRFRLEDNTADGSSAAQVVIGPTLPTHDSLDTVEVAFFHNGTHLDTVKGSAASGHPANGVIWLADQLHQVGGRLEAGQIVITGGLTPAVALAPATSSPHDSPTRPPSPSAGNDTTQSIGPAAASA